VVVVPKVEVRVRVCWEAAAVTSIEASGVAGDQRPDGGAAQ
jgi:hypothetical protein